MTFRIINCFKAFAFSILVLKTAPADAQDDNWTGWKKIGRLQPALGGWTSATLENNE